MYFEKAINIDSITQEIRASSIKIALDYINSSGSACDIFFKDTLSDSDMATLNRIISAHVPIPIKNTIPTIKIISTPAFASKTFDGKNLFKRVIGQQFTLTVGDNTLMYTETFPWVKFMSLEIIGGEIGDYVSLYVLDTATGTYSGHANYPLNQFGFNANIAAGFYQHKSEFDADIYAGLQINIVYNSVSAKTIGINYVMNEVK